MMELIFFSKKHLELITPVHEAGSFSQTFVLMSEHSLHRLNTLLQSVCL